MPNDRRRSISLQRFSLGDMLRCGVDIRRVAADAGSLEAAAGRVVDHLHHTLRDPESGRHCCVLLRCFVTLPLASLDAGLQTAARAAAGDQPIGDDTRCLVLLATAGERREWNDRRASAGHRAIPLPSPEVVAQAPMISRMIQQMGVDIGTLVARVPRAAGASGERNYDVFYVEEAAGSPYIPAQKEFVEPFGVRSVIGFGGILQEEFFVFVLFSREAVPREAASRFRTLAMDARLALLRHEGRTVFETGRVPVFVEKPA